MSPVRTHRSILDDPDEGHKFREVFQGENHREIVETAVEAATKFFGDDDRFIFLVEGFEAYKPGQGLKYRAELTIRRLRKGSEEWDRRLKEVVAEHESDETTTSCHAHEEDRPCCIDYIAGLDGTEYEDRPTRAD